MIDSKMSDILNRNKRHGAVLRGDEQTTFMAVIGALTFPPVQEGLQRAPTQCNASENSAASVSVQNKPIWIHHSDRILCASLSAVD